MSGVRQLGSRTSILTRKGPGVWDITGLDLDEAYVLAELTNSALGALAERHHIDLTKVGEVSVETARQWLAAKFRSQFEWIETIEFPDVSFPDVPEPLRLGISLRRDGNKHIWLSDGKFDRYYPERSFRATMTNLIKSQRNEGIRNS